MVLTDSKLYQCHMDEKCRRLHHGITRFGELNLHTISMLFVFLCVYILYHIFISNDVINRDKLITRSHNIYQNVWFHYDTTVG